jgi:uncharacterized protein YutE (UPF0331/DUF86 family)
MINNYLYPRVENIIEVLRKDFKLIASKRKDDEWKRDHYRYAFTISAQRMFDLLNSQLTKESVSSVSESTKKELIRLRNQINSLLQ